MPYFFVKSIHFLCSFTTLYFIEHEQQLFLRCCSIGFVACCTLYHSLLDPRHKRHNNNASNDNLQEVARDGAERLDPVVVKDDFGKIIANDFDDKGCDDCQCIDQHFVAGDFFGDQPSHIAHRSYNYEGERCPYRPWGEQII